MFTYASEGMILSLFLLVISIISKFSENKSYITPYFKKTSFSYTLLYIMDLYISDIPCLVINQRETEIKVMKEF